MGKQRLVQLAIRIAAVCLALTVAAHAQDARELVTIDYPEQLPLEALADYVSQSLDIHILYTDELKNQSVVLRPGRLELPKDRLLDLLRAVLSARGLVLVEGTLPELYRIAPLKDVQRLADAVRTEQVPEVSQPGRIVTQVIVVPSGDTKQVASRIEPFLSAGKSSVIEVPERGTLIVTDYEPVVARIARLIELVDVPAEQIRTDSVPIATPDATRLCEQVTAIMMSEAAATPMRHAAVLVRPAMVPSTVLITGTTTDIARARELLQQFDTSIQDQSITKTYTPEHASVTRLKTLAERILRMQGQSESAVSIFADESANRLYVNASQEVQARIQRLLADEDRPIPSTARRMRTYRPQHRTAGEILDTLTQLLDDATVVRDGADENMQAETSTNRSPPGPNRPPSTPGSGQVLPIPPAQVRDEEPEARPTGPRRVEGPNYVLTEDEATNAIIAVGTPEFHAQLTSLLAELDRRPAQVLIEMTLLAVTVNSGVDLGVELQGYDLGNGTDFLLFSSFGLSTVDGATGQRVFTPGVGVNGVLIRPDRMPVILRALATQGDSRVVSSPRMLVSDNTTATLRNVDEAPFTSVNASDTVATTSFAGFESAGTTLTVTPHIAEGDHLTLKYNLSFSNFAGASSQATVPPPRTTNSFTSEVQIPDGFTIVVGGLDVENESDAVSEVPILGRIPVVGMLFQNSTASRTKTRIYAFIRPVILRDDQFADLRYLSANALDDADLENTDYPKDELMWMR